MTSTVTLVLDDQKIRHICQPDETVRLTRYVLSTPDNNALHRSPRDVPGVRRAGGRWQLHYAKPSPSVTVAVIRHDGRPITADTRQEVEEALSTSSANVFLRGTGPGLSQWNPEMDLYDGCWVIGLRTSEPKWYLIRLHVNGQPAITDDPLNQDDPVGVSTWTEVKRGGSAVPSAQWPPFRTEVDDPVDLARRWLNGEGAMTQLSGKLRRIALGYFYREFLLNLPGARNVSRHAVFVDLGLDSDKTVDGMREELIRKLWASGSASQNDLCRFILANRLLTMDDVRAADAYKSQFKPKAAARERALHLQQRRARNAERRSQATEASSVARDDAATTDEPENPDSCD